MTPEQAAQLREPFPAETIGKLPRSWCRACSDSPRKRCDQHQWVSRCDECSGSHTSATLHLDYVGHAATTDRLLQVDPEWTWEPLALAPDGLPATDRAGNLWIRLTIAGVTRLGVGDGKSAKECIGDAIRNAAMRFGVALDLWAKEDLHVTRQETPPTAPAGPTNERTAPPATGEGETAPVREAQEPPEVPSPAAVTRAQLRMLHTSLSNLAVEDREERLALVGRMVGRRLESSNDLTKQEASRVIDRLTKAGTVQTLEAELQTEEP